MVNTLGFLVALAILAGLAWLALDGEAWAQRGVRKIARRFQRRQEQAAAQQVQLPGSILNPLPGDFLWLVVFHPEQMTDLHRIGVDIGMRTWHRPGEIMVVAGGRSEAGLSYLNAGANSEPLRLLRFATNEQVGRFTLRVHRDRASAAAEAQLAQPPVPNPVFPDDNPMVWHAQP